VFGTSIIGLSLDYSIHFFSHGKISSIFQCLALGFLTTQLGYLALITTQVPLLCQIAAFSIFGLLSSFLSVNILFPRFNLPPQNRRIPAVCKINKAVVFAVVAAILAFGLPKLKIENKLQEFYTMSKELQNSEMLAAKVMNMGTGSFYIVSGNSPEETLENEENLRSHLDSNYMAVSAFVPSAKLQTKVYNSIEKNLLPLYEKQFIQLGFDSATAKNKAVMPVDKILTLDDPMPAVIKQAVDKLWIGEVDGKYYSAVVLLKASDKRPQIDNAILVDKKSEIEAGLHPFPKK